MSVMLALTLSLVIGCKPEEEPNNGGNNPEQPVNPNNPGQPANPNIEGPDIRTFTVDGVSFDMRKVQGGTYWMGAQQDNENGQNYDPQSSAEETPPHQVTMSGFYMGKYEVTQELWRAVMGNNPSTFQGDGLPVESVGWNAVQDFLTTLNTKVSDQLPAGMQFRLPTEAQWEYAARGGNQSHGYTYSGSNDLSSVGWFGENSGEVTHPVGLKEPNELFLYDMSGNVAEWCSDYRSGKKYGEIGYVRDPQTDPIGPSAKFVGYSENHITRGGCYSGQGYGSGSRSCRVACRRSPSTALSTLGLRLVLSYSAGQPSVPGLQTDPSLNITTNSVGVRGWFISDGGSYITECGCCYGTSSDLAHNGTCVTAELTDSRDFYVTVNNLQAGQQYFICTYAKNNVGIAYGETVSFGAAIGLTTAEITNITATTAIAGGIVPNTGVAVTSRGICWSMSNNPTIDDNKITIGSGSGEFTGQITGLRANTTYYVRAFAVSNGTTSYGNTVTFTTLPPEVPMVTTLSASCWNGLYGYEWSASGIITSDGGANIDYRKVGILISTDPNPTFNGNNYTLEVSWENGMEGVGSTFTVSWGGINPNTTYYFRAFAVNSVGVGYGEVIAKTTGGYPQATVITSPVSNITSTTAVCGGSVITTGQVMYTAICWSTSPNPVVGVDHTLDGDAWSYTMTGLTPNTTYYVRFFAAGENMQGGYGDNQMFTTLP